MDQPSPALIEMLRATQLIGKQLLDSTAAELQIWRVIMQIGPAAMILLA
ncbi:MAG: hypothetical protein AAF968_15640 [Pseudomonadota bacterium]